MFKKPQLLFYVVVLLAVACSKEDTDTDETPKLDKIEIASFRILENSSKGVTTETKIIFESSAIDAINDHGLHILKGNLPYDKVSLGQLSNKSFVSTVSSGLTKGESYSIYPYIYAKNTFFYGDTLEFVSNVDIDVEVFDWYPRQGFVKDTINIIGKNFCKSSGIITNIFTLNNIEQELIFESDSLIRSVVLPNIDKSILSAALGTCNETYLLEPNFVVDPPTLDSIAPHEAYLGETFTIYGKNFHSDISKVWIGDFEVELLPDRQNDSLRAVVTKDFPPGLLDLKIQVLDRFIDKESGFQSTTPIIHELDKVETGFLDTLTIKGAYLVQPNENLEVLVGGRNQKILESSKEEIKIVIDTYFEEEDPKLVVHTGDFSLTEDIDMLPPQIISFDKEEYHLYDDEITIETKYFLGFKSNVRIGEAESSDYGYEFDPIDSEGNLTISLTRWLEAVGNRYPDFVFDATGEIKIALTTAYGTAEMNFKVFAPFIESLSEDTYFHNNSIQLNGLDFGYDEVSKVFIDDTEVVFQGLSTYAQYNKTIYFPVPENLLPGTHNIKVVTGGQESNILQFELGNITVSGLTPDSGTRNTVYTITGANLDNPLSYEFKLNGFLCTELNATPNQVQITLPYFIPLEPNNEITFTYGSQSTSAGFINGIEPYEIIEDYQKPSGLSKYSGSFEYNGRLYGLTYDGIYEFDTSNGSWSIFESNMPQITNYFINSYYISVVGDEVYVYYENGFLVYNMTARTWSRVDLQIEGELIIHRAVVYGNDAYLFMKRPENVYYVMMYKYDLTNDTYELTSQPTLKNNFGMLASNRVYEENGKIFLDVLDDYIMMYDIVTDTWENIGFPKGDSTFHYDNSLYYYDNVLYFSGGRGNEPTENTLFGYDFNTKVWSEKTSMPLKLHDHTIFGDNGYLYLLLGAGEYGYDNQELMRYNISEDPN